MEGSTAVSVEKHPLYKLRTASDSISNTSGRSSQTCGAWYEGATAVSVEKREKHHVYKLRTASNFVSSTSGFLLETVNFWAFPEKRCHSSETKIRPWPSPQQTCVPAKVWASRQGWPDNAQAKKHGQNKGTCMGVGCNQRFEEQKYTRCFVFMGIFSSQRCLFSVPEVGVFRSRAGGRTFPDTF